MEKLKKNYIWFIIGLILFILLLWKLGFQQTITSLREMNLGFFLIAIGFLLTALIMLFVKWIFLCRVAHLKFSVREVLLLFSKIMILGTFTPGRTGEFFTILISKENRGIVSALILFNRIIESSITLFIAILAFGIFFRNFIPRTSWFLIFLACTIIIGLVGMLRVKSIGIIVFSIVEKFLKLFIRYRFVKSQLSKKNRFFKEYENFHTSIVQLFSPNVLFIALVITFFVWLLVLMGNRFIFLSVDIHLPFLTLLAYVPLSAISAFVSPAPGGIGIGDIPPVYFLYWAGYQENIGGYLVLSKIILYWTMTGLYFISFLMQKTK